MRRKLKMGMLGGGPGAFIGEVHRKAARMDGFVDIVAGAFDIDPVKSHQMGKELNLDSSRVYDDYKKMIEGELAMDKKDRIDFVSITTPNNWHFPMARDFLKAGFHVMCEKPMTITVDEALELQKLVEETGKVFGLMHTYTGYPMAKLGKDLISKGELGNIRKIVVRYPQGWLTDALEKTGQMQASWRTDPKQTGAGGSIGDIGIHAANLAEYFTGLRINEISADITSFVEGRPVDDDANILLRFDSGAKGVLFCSQISVGEENDLAIWIYGTKKSLEWHQEEPNYLYVKEGNGPMQVWKRGNPYVAEMSEAAGRGTRLPSGHPEALLEAIANIYNNFGDTIRKQEDNLDVDDKLISDFPNVDDGVRGMKFIDTVIKNSKGNEKWTSI
ncbi:MAG: Gfo/Idh/MocA family oxidoreductase [Ignavibacteriales bacterium]|nr:Gfo/Idh/MocA family oxidoreductase [Ignavibacteriales bacterium]MCB9218269.1 Gfo/Idh/MocA family oxidoreductase [Ignavibacteriales bacterium]